MKNIFTLTLCVFMGTMAMGQEKPEGVFAKATVAPVIDGVVDAVWTNATVYNIDKPYRTETPTLGESGETTWQGLWNDAGVYILLKVADDNFYPAYEIPTPDSWMGDKPEIYFDVNYDLEDGLGASAGMGHIQVAPPAIDGKIDGTPTTETNGVVYAFLVDGEKYTAEYFIPFTVLIDKEQNQVDVTNTIGFDVTIIDRDPDDAGRRRAVWANVGAIDESWSNMNDAGHVTFEGGEPPVWVETITLNSGGTITTDNGTLQMVATVMPENATSKSVKWTVENGTGKASIDANGLVTALMDGTVTVKATALDPGGATATTEITISGQTLTKQDVWNNFNIVKNWNTVTDLTSWANWIDPEAYPNQVAPKVVDGIVVMQPNLATDNAAWHYQFNQSPLSALPNVPYVLYFKSWASGNAPAVVDFESGSGITPANGGDQYVRYGASSDPEAVGGRSEWNYNLTADPKWYTFHVTFDQIIPTTIQKVQWMLSLSNETVYLDSILLVTQDLFDQLATLPTASKTLASSIDKVYPNPVGNSSSLFVELKKANSTVAIYNSLGQKLTEKTVAGHRAVFNVSSLRQGLYFIKTNDGSIQKFVK